jgi:hypothetical protein
MDTDNQTTDFLLAEYHALRDEILKRTDIQHQLNSITLVAFGALASVGLQVSQTALLAYPLLALFLSVVWSYNDLRIRQLGIYIRDRIENRLADMGEGWEHAISSDALSRSVGSRVILATRGIFWGTELLAIGIYLINRLGSVFPRGDVVLLGLDILALGYTIVILRRQKVSREKIAESIQKAE